MPALHKLHPKWACWLICFGCEWLGAEVGGRTFGLGVLRACGPPDSTARNVNFGEWSCGLGTQHIHCCTLFFLSLPCVDRCGLYSLSYRGPWCPRPPYVFTEFTFFLLFKYQS
ncbi:uncharacterized protein K460DRAFT_77372 [Cucurbitaria berberidis CBS 394.84]|uniref:Secreted protein n=1 Tax=Cucurbitaria berberidis CBS 394.84 TaxID=1168544 RepID=A0A9P4GNR9_9PLEO|nr:uncharacterized protein K460DRAFT_77372 [Cucurbitaria berberidis CBS 394.84]KAF1848574.1 hypothetical protein K460DRAFT_77372 [Cucurbitaria berberidis CBS 394.84]